MCFRFIISGKGSNQQIVFIDTTLQFYLRLYSMNRKLLFVSVPFLIRILDYQKQWRISRMLGHQGHEI
jgi:hypothetical protein